MVQVDSWIVFMDVFGREHPVEAGSIFLVSARK
jgi:hypothetical protein